MQSFSRGDTFWGLIPHQEKKGFSEKLCIVLEGSRSLYTLAPCTTSTFQDHRYKKTILIPKNSVWGLALELDEDSLVMLDRVDAYDDSIIIGSHTGKAPEDLMQKIEDEMDS